MKAVSHHSALFMVSVGAAFLTACAVRTPKPPAPWPRQTWNDPSLWTINRNAESKGTVTLENDSEFGAVLRLDFALGGNHGYVELTHQLSNTVSLKMPVAFRFKAEGGHQLELKWVDSDGSVNGTRIPVTPASTNWTDVVLHVFNTEYWWGGRDCDLDDIAAFQIAVSPKGSGTLWLDVQGLVDPTTPSTLPRSDTTVDPECEMPGIGFQQRRHAEMQPEDPLVLEWLKLLQDTSSPERQLLPSTRVDNEAQTFNNALCALAFMVKGERERAERILDFYAQATRRDNEDPTLQNFFFRGEARGFYQSVALRSEGRERAYHTRSPVDRWMGDMVWLMFAYKYHERLYGPERYEKIRTLLLELLLSWYTDASDGRGGYLRHGWIKGDSKLHEPFGHPEGNIDAYALTRLCGHNDVADKIRAWLEPRLCGKALPLDLYTWRVLAFGKEVADVLSIPECDFRYRKTLEFQGHRVVGFYDHADILVNNIWLDGLGHMACAYFTAGNQERAYFYANQMDLLIIAENISGQVVHTLPYTANRTGGYDWVDPQRGFVSVAAWYILAKNRFNPMTLEHY